MYKKFCKNPWTNKDFKAVYKVMPTHTHLLVQQSSATWLLMFCVASKCSRHKLRRAHIKFNKSLDFSTKQYYLAPT